MASAWACSTFQDFLIGLEFILETDHKPLVSLLGTKSIDELPARIQRMRMRLMRFSYTVVHVPGKDLHIADTLSRAPQATSHPNDTELQEEISCYVAEVMTTLPASDRKLEEIRIHQDEDEICRQIKVFCHEGWPAKHQLSGPLGIYWQHQGSILVEEGLLLYSTRLVIPSSLRLSTLDKLHQGHQGIVIVIVDEIPAVVAAPAVAVFCWFCSECTRINKCRAHARQSVWWPGNTSGNCRSYPEL